MDETLDTSTVEEGMSEASTRELPGLPDRITRWTVDRHYTALVDVLRDGGPPGAVAENAHEVLVSQVRTGYPSDAVPDYISRLGQTDALRNRYRRRANE